jgi:hypothetical protein
MWTEFFSFFDPDYPTCGLNVNGLVMVYCIATNMRQSVSIACPRSLTLASQSRHLDAGETAGSVQTAIRGEGEGLSLDTSISLAVQLQETESINQSILFYKAHISEFTCDLYPIQLRTLHNEYQELPPHPRIKRPGREAVSSPPYTVWCLINKLRDKFIFTLKVWNTATCYDALPSGQGISNGNVPDLYSVRISGWNTDYCHS